MVSYSTLLRIYVGEESGPELAAKYKYACSAHNEKIVTNGKFPDAGFDLYVPSNYWENDETYLTNRLSETTFKLPRGVKGAMIQYSDASYPDIAYTGYYLYARSSIVKTPLRLANSVGIIDSGYRGEVTAVVDKHDTSNDWKTVLKRDCKKFDRLFQICSPGLTPFRVELVERESDLSGKTDRGDGGFGSTTLPTSTL